MILETILTGREGKEVFRGAGDVLHFNLRSGFTGVYICKKINQALDLRFVHFIISCTSLDKTFRKLVMV